MKTLDALGYVVGAVTWPWLAGYFAGLEETLASAFVAVTLLGWAFVAWWKIFKYLRNLIFGR